MNTALPLIFSGILTLSVILAACPTNQDPYWVDNTHGAPLVIVGKQHTITVKNTTQRTVESYQLGCVRNDPLSIAHRFPLQKTQIAPSTGAMVATFDAPPEEQVTCQKIRAKASVLEATFTDGTKWQLSDQLPHSSQDSSTQK